MLDYITLSIMAVGVLILGLWIVIPIREFRTIFKSLKQRPHAQNGETKGDRA